MAARLRAQRPTERQRARPTWTSTSPTTVGGLRRRAVDTAETDVARAGLGGVGRPCSDAVAVAVAVVTEVGTASHDPAYLSVIGVRRLGRHGVEDGVFRRPLGVLGRTEGVAAPFPHVADRVVKAEAVGRELG